MVYFFYLPPISPWIKALTIDCFYFSDQEVKMEEAMSHTGIRQFYLSLQWLYYYFFSFNTCMGWNCLIPTNTSIHGVLALNLWLHAGDDLTNHSYMMCFFPPPSFKQLYLSSPLCAPSFFTFPCCAVAVRSNPNITCSHVCLRLQHFCRMFKCGLGVVPL